MDRHKFKRNGGHKLPKSDGSVYMYINSLASKLIHIDNRFCFAFCYIRQFMFLSCSIQQWHINNILKCWIYIYVHGLMDGVGAVGVPLRFCAGTNSVQWISVAWNVYAPCLVDRGGNKWHNTLNWFKHICHSVMLVMAVLGPLLGGMLYV